MASATSSAPDSPPDLLKFFQLSTDPAVFVLKSTERRITAYSQQNRALRLARTVREKLKRFYYISK